MTPQNRLGRLSWAKLNVGLQTLHQLNLVWCGGRWEIVEGRKGGWGEGGGRGGGIGWDINKCIHGNVQNQMDKL